MLPFNMLARTERVFPADIVPVADMETQRQNAGLISQIGQKPVGRRASRAALRGLELNHREALIRMRG